MYLKNIPWFYQWLFPLAVFRGDRKRKLIYLTFDDGPDEKSTPQLLRILDEYSVKATFFCLGKKVMEFPEVFQSITASGQGIANHSFDHINGWRKNHTAYILNVEKAGALIESSVFRPPYGKISFQQYRKLKQHFKIVFWTSMPGDFEADVSSEKLLLKMKRDLKNGAIYVLHDHPETIERKKQYLGNFISFAKTKGYEFGIFQ